MSQNDGIPKRAKLTGIKHSSKKHERMNRPALVMNLIFSPFLSLIFLVQDVSGHEQESICLRYVNSDLHLHEDFVGQYQIPSTTSEAIAGMVFDVLTRFGLSISNLRARTYDGAANMSGHYTGCQERVREWQPLAIYFHCASHISNLVMQNAVISCPLVRNDIRPLVTVDN